MADIHLLRDELFPPAEPARRHLISVDDLERDDVERLRVLRRLVEERTGVELGLGQLDITFHRDDVHVREGNAPRRRQPVVRDTKLDFELEGRTVILVDDVLYTGRTIRAAIDALLEYGRPARVQLAVLADRGHRELPIRPDYVGKNLPTARDERVQVQLVEIDEVDRVLLIAESEECC